MSDAVAAEPLHEVRATHPKGLYVLFATEMWERFSYYGMRALLVLYLLHQLGWQPSESSTTYKWYTSLVFLAPLFGGFLADRYFGLRNSIIAGGVLMAIGHFLMAIPSLPVLFAALGFLVVGNGLFKPNISTLVGRMYGAHDVRRNSAFTIFYVGVNLGAALAPLVCGTLRKSLGFHYGFAAAGVGMIIGLVTFIVFQKQIRADVEAVGNSMGLAVKSNAERLEQQAPSTRGASARQGRPPQALFGNADVVRDPGEALPGQSGFPGFIARVTPTIMIAGGLAVPVRFAIALARGETSLIDVAMPTALGLIAVAMGFVLRSIRGVARDKSVVIFVLFAFTVVFWMAFEQAGNALNIWADIHTDLHIGSLEYPAEYWQFVNPILIVSLGPVLSILWIVLARKGREPSTPAKMLAAMVLMALSFGAMVAGARAENSRTTRVSLVDLPSGASLENLDAGRLRYDPASHELEVRGVLAPFAVTEALEAVSAPQYRGELARLPSGDAAARDHLLRRMVPGDYARALDQLAAASNQARTSGLWLFLCYLFSTLGELCLSPVGLSMVTKLAPARFASLFMGVWFLGLSVAEYVGGSLGENWGKVTPGSYFATFVWTSCAGAIALAMLVIPLRRLMHDAAR
jgi:POT family proton-dependent oligopeptide transporter